MIIANYDEFIQVINSLFNSCEVNDFTSFVDELAKSKKTRNIKRNRYETELKKLKVELKETRQKLRQSEQTESKRKYSAELKKLNQIKQELVKKNKIYSELSIFNEMSENAKIYACCRHLLSKYLPQALYEDMTSLAKQNDDASITINSQAFKDSRLYQDAAHIKDYITSYFENYPERIKGTRYFIGLHRKASVLSDLLDGINKYFEKLNSPNEKESNRIKKSHFGINVVKTYPEQHLQLVRVSTKAGLNYEGSAMHHCVGSYATKVERGETQIYSLRDQGDENKELIPHATVEFKNGKIAQIKGPYDSVIEFKYVDTVRDMLLTLIKSNNFQDIINDTSIPSSDKNNIGVFKDANGKTHDLLNFDEQNAIFESIIITKEALTALPLHKMKIKNLTYRGSMDDKSLAELMSLRSIERLHFKSLEYSGEVFDYSAMPITDIFLEINAPNLKQIILPRQTTSLSLMGNFDSMEGISVPQTTKQIKLEGSFAKLHILPDNTDDITLKGCFPALKTLPDNIRILGLSGKFPKLNVINIGALEYLRVENSDVFSNTDILLIPNLKHLSLYGECTSQISKLPPLPLLESLSIGGSNYELGKQYVKLADNFTADYPHLQSLVLNGTFPEIKELDLSRNPKLEEIDAMGAKFENLEIIKFPDSLSTCVFDFASFPKVRELDFSDIKGKHFGKIESFNLGNLSFVYSGPSQGKQSSHIQGISLSFACFNSLESIKFPLVVETLNLQNFSGASHAQKFNFEKLNKLKEVNLSLIPFDKVPHLDLSHCQELRDLCIDGNILNRAVLPASIEKLSVISVGENKEMPDISLDDTIYKNIKTLECTGFVPDRHLLKPSIENLTINANNSTLDNLTEINMGNYKYVNLQLSGSSLRKLEKVIFPQTFKKMYFYNTSDKFNELDFSNTVGEVRIHPQNGFTDEKDKNSYFKIIRNGIVQEADNEGHQFDNFLLLSDEQLQNINHIKLGKDTCLLIHSQMPLSPNLSVEIANNTSPKLINIMREQNPKVSFIKKQNSRNATINITDINAKGRN